LLLDAHADTVGANGMTIPPCDPQVRDGRLYGRGSCDTKGGMAAMLLAIRAVLDESGRPPVTLHFTATGDEEDGGLGAARLVETGFKADAAIIAEPTDLRIVYAHKGACRFRVALRGKAAHSSVPELGVNAVEAAADLIQAIRGQFIGRLMYRVHPDLGKAITCVTVIEGGERVNIVPDRCQIEVDCRCLPGERRHHLEQVMRGLLDELVATQPGLRYECEIFQWYPALAGSRSDAFVTRMAAAARLLPGPDPLVTAPYGTNAGFFSEVGIPCVVFGPGSIAQAHTADEYVELDQVARAVPVYANMIRSME
jgi:acetylornithine deacetylase